MIEIKYKEKNHNQIISACVQALKRGKVVAYPTDTSYGLAADASNTKAIKKLYRVKGRDFNKAVSVVVPSLEYAKKIAAWDNTAFNLAKRFWPGALTLVLGLRAKGLGLSKIASQGFLGLRMPKNKVALDLSAALKKPITATSANVSGQPDCYLAADVIKQFARQKYKPDIIINAGKLPKRKPSTIAKIDGDKIEIIRQGPVSEKEILRLTKIKKFK